MDDERDLKVANGAFHPPRAEGGLFDWDGGPWETLRAHPAGSPELGDGGPGRPGPRGLTDAFTGPRPASAWPEPGLGAQTTLTLLVARVDGFARLSEAAPAATLLQVVNRYLGALSTTVGQKQGQVDRFSSDGVTAIFRDPVAAVRAAILIQQRLARLEAELIGVTHQTFPTRLGLATGPCLIAWIGSPERPERAVLGRTALVAENLPAFAPPGGLVLDPTTFQSTGVLPVARARVVNTRGDTGPRTIYEVPPESLADLDDFLAGRA